MPKDVLLAKTLAACQAGQRYIRSMDAMLAQLDNPQPGAAQKVQEHFSEWSKKNREALELHRRLRAGG